MTGEIEAVVKKMLKVIGTGSTEGIMGDAKDQRAEELKYCGELGAELGALWRRDDTG